MRVSSNIGSGKIRKIILLDTIPHLKMNKTMYSFGSPNHTSIWFEDPSLNYPNGAHFDKLRNDMKIWREHILSNGIYPCFTSCTTESDDDIDTTIRISGFDSDIEEPTHNYKDTKCTIDEKKMETLWKLYRNAGESMEDLKIRLLHTGLQNPNFTKKTTDPTSTEDDETDPVLPYAKNRLLHTGPKNPNVTKKTTDLTSTEDDETDTVVSSVKFESVKSKYYTINNFDDILEVELQETNESIQLADTQDDIDIQDWSFKSPIWYKLSNYESLDSMSNCTYDVPRLKQITNDELIVSKKSSSQRKCNQAKKDERIVKRSNDAIICDMYGTRTINYNESPPRVKIPNCFKTSKLSDSSYDEEIELFEKPKRLVKKRKFSILKNQFRNSRRPRIVDYEQFFNSFVVDLSDESDTEDSRKKRKMSNFNGYKSQEVPTTTSSTSSTTCMSTCSCSTSTTTSDMES